MTPTTYSARFTLYCPDHSNSRLLIGVVDTGASFTVIPAHILDELGVPRVEQETFILADGSEHDLAIGDAIIQLQGYTASVRVVFGSDPHKTLIGFSTLVAVRLAVDPVHRRLLPVDRLVLLDEEGTL